MSDRIDITTISSLRAGNPDLWKQLVDVYIEDALECLEKLDSALSRKSSTEVHRVAHTLKSSSANMGGKKLSELCQMLESDAEEAKLDHGETLLAQIKHEFSLLKDEIGY